MFKKISIVILLAVIYKAGSIYYEVNRSEMTDTTATASDGSSWHTKDRCFRSAELIPGTTKGAWYNTVSPNEAFASERTHTFPHTCNLRELLNQPDGKLEAQVVHRTLNALPAIYNIATRNRDEIFVLGGVTGKTEWCEENSEACATGAYIAKVNAHTLQIEWRKPLYNAKVNGDWDYPGAIGVHGNGNVYVVNGYRIYKIDPDSGEVLSSNDLPTAPNQKQGDTAYNGFNILSDGNLVMKSLTRIKGSQADSIVALLFRYADDVPSTIAVIEPDNLELVSSIKVQEPVLGRISNTQFEGVEYVYVGGFDNLFRFKYANNKIEMDNNWGPVRYRFDDQKPAPAPGIMNDWVVIQNNFQISKDALSVTVISQKDSSVMHRITPFEESGLLPGSLQFSLPTIDEENNRIYSYDVLENELVALDFDPIKGLSVAWRVEQRSLSFGAVLGPKENRVFVLEDSASVVPVNAHLVWRDANTGKELLRSGLVSTAPGMPITPGFDGTFYYVSSLQGRLTELNVVANASKSMALSK